MLSGAALVGFALQTKPFSVNAPDKLRTLREISVG